MSRKPLKAKHDWMRRAGRGRAGRASGDERSGCKARYETTTVRGEVFTDATVAAGRGVCRGRIEAMVAWGEAERAGRRHRIGAPCLFPEPGRRLLPPGGVDEGPRPVARGRVSGRQAVGNGRRAATGQREGPPPTVTSGYVGWRRSLSTVALGKVARVRSTRATGSGWRRIPFSRRSAKSTSLPPVTPAHGADAVAGGPDDLAGRGRVVAGPAGEHARLDPVVEPPGGPVHCTRVASAG